jgi:hypothetical protein
MEGFQARGAALGVALCAALILGAPAWAAADSPLAAAVAPGAPPVPAVTAATETVDAAIAPALRQADAVASEVAGVASSARRAAPAVDGGVGAKPVAQPVRRMARVAQPAERQSAARPAGRGHSPRAHERVPVRPRTSSPPHGRKTTPPARSDDERAAGAPAAGAHPAVEAGQPRGPGPGIAGAARALEAFTGMAFAAFLVAALGALLQRLLRPLRIPSPASALPAFAAPVEPPG